MVWCVVIIMVCIYKQEEDTPASLLPSSFKKTCAEPPWLAWLRLRPKAISTNTHAPSPPPRYTHNSTTTTMPPTRRDSAARRRTLVLVALSSFLLLLPLLLSCDGRRSSSSRTSSATLPPQRKATTSPSCFLFPSVSSCVSSRAAGTQSGRERRSTDVSLTAR